MMIDLEFDSTSRAEAFREFLNSVVQTPQARAELVEHRTPVILDVMEEHTLA